MRVLLLLLALAGVARADTPRPAKAPPDTRSHKGQLEVSLRIPLGLRAIATYDKGIYCGKLDSSTTSGFSPVCTGRVPFSFDFELGYGIARSIDLLLELRVGLEQDFGATPQADEGPRPFHVSPGARFFFNEGRTSKLFTTAQFVIDASGYKDQAGVKRGTDVGFRNLTGLWFDLDRAYGLYLFVGETATFARWMQFELEAGVGVQGRYR